MGAIDVCRVQLVSFRFGLTNGSKISFLFFTIPSLPRSSASILLPFYRPEYIARYLAGPGRVPLTPSPTSRRSEFAMSLHASLVQHGRLMESVAVLYRSEYNVKSVYQSGILNSSQATPRRLDQFPISFRAILFRTNATFSLSYGDTLIIVYASIQLAMARQIPNLRTPY